MTLYHQPESVWSITLSVDFFLIRTFNPLLRTIIQFISSKSNKSEHQKSRPQWNGGVSSPVVCVAFVWAGVFESGKFSKPRFAKCLLSRSSVRQALRTVLITGCKLCWVFFVVPDSLTEQKTHLLSNLYPLMSEEKITAAMK